MLFRSLVREVFVTGEPGNRKFNFEDGIGTRGTTPIAAPVFMEAQRELKSKLGNPEDFQSGQLAGEVFFEETSSGIEFIEAQVDRAGLELESDRFDDDDTPNTDPQSDDVRNAQFWAAQMAGVVVDTSTRGAYDGITVSVEGGKAIMVLDGSVPDGSLQAFRNELVDHGFDPDELELRTRDDPDGPKRRIFVNNPTDTRLTTDWWPDGWRDFDLREQPRHPLAGRGVRRA